MKKKNKTSTICFRAPPSAGQFRKSSLTLCLFSSRAFTRSIAAGVSETGAFLCRRRRDRGDGAVEAGGGEEVDGVVASSVLEAEAASAENGLRRLRPLAELLLLIQLLPPDVDAVRAEARRVSRSLAVVPPPPLLLPPATTTAAERSAAIIRLPLLSSSQKKSELENSRLLALFCSSLARHTT